MSSLITVSHQALALPLSTWFLPSFNSKHILFIHVLFCTPLLMLLIPDLVEFVVSFTQCTSFSSKSKPKESLLPEPCSFHYCPTRALVLLGCELKQKLKLTEKELFLTPFFFLWCAPQCAFRNSSPPPQDFVVDHGAGSENFITTFTTEATQCCSYILGGLWSVGCGSPCLHHGQTFKCVHPLNGGKSGTSARFWFLPHVCGSDQ